MYKDCHSIQAKLDTAEQENFQLKSKADVLTKLIEILNSNKSTLTKLEDMHYAIYRAGL